MSLATKAHAKWLQETYPAEIVFDHAFTGVIRNLFQEEIRKRQAQHGLGEMGRTVRVSLTLSRTKESGLTVQAHAQFDFTDITFEWRGSTTVQYRRMRPASMEELRFLLRQTVERVEHERVPAMLQTLNESLEHAAGPDHPLYLHPGQAEQIRFISKLSHNCSLHLSCHLTIRYEHGSSVTVSSRTLSLVDAVRTMESIRVEQTAAEQMETYLTGSGKQKCGTASW